MTETASGSCQCTTVRFRIDGTFDGFFLCHCSRCRKDTGSAHAANLFSSTATLTWIAGGDTVRTFHVPGTRHQRSFCPGCGSGLPGFNAARELLVVPAGCLDTPFDRRPDAHIFFASRAVWDSHLGTVPTFDALPS
jgi:hypothetical protein